MITRCPQCHAWFRVRAEHLSAANGFVTCGECDAVFNALSTLIEETGTWQSPPDARDNAPDALRVTDAQPAVPAAKAPPDVDTDARAEIRPSPDESAEAGNGGAAPPARPADLDSEAPDPELDIAEFEELLAAQGDLPVPDPAAAGGAALDSARAAVHGAAGSLPEASLSAGDHAILFTQPGAGDDADDADDTIPEYLGGGDPPAVLQSDLEALVGLRRRRGLSRMLWNGLTVAALGAVVAQLAWVYRDEVAARLPAAGPVIEAVCRAIGCDDRAGPATETLRLLARDVREHPQYLNTLLVNATMINEAPASQPFPVIELTLHDAVGNVLGARRFQPHEYLDESIAIDDGMPPDRPVYIVMELGGGAHTAVSFEFRFL